MSTTPLPKRNRKSLYPTAEELYSRTPGPKTFIASIYPWLVCTLAAVFYCYETLLRMTPSVIMVELMEAFQITAIGSLGAFYYYAYTPMQLFSGVTVDKFGPRGVLTFATLSCALGTILFGATDIYAVACFARFLIGFGSSFAFVGVLKLATIWLPENRFAMVTGLATTLGTIGAMFGQVIIAYFIQSVGWRACFWYAAIAGLILAPVIYAAVRNAPRNVVEDEHAVLRAEMSFAHLMQVMFSIFKNGQVWLCGLIGCCMYLPIIIFAELHGPYYLQTVYQLTRQESIEITAFVLLGWAIGGPLAGYASDRFGRRKPLIQLSSFLGMILFAIILYVPNLTTVHLSALFLLMGFVTSSQVTVFAIGRENCSSKVSGAAVSIVNFIIMIGGVVFQPLVDVMLGMVTTQNLVDGRIIFTEIDYQIVFSLFPIGFAISLICSLLLKETYCRSRA